MARARPRGPAAPPGRSAEHSPRGRSVAPPARRRAHRPVPDALARGGRHSARGLLGYALAAERRREGPRRRALQSRFRAARSSGAARTRGHAAAAVSAIRREVAAAELPWCAAHHTGVIVYSPMQSGLLTGAFSVTRATQLGADDWRSRSPDFTGQGLRRNLALADALRPIAGRHGTTVAAVA